MEELRQRETSAEPGGPHDEREHIRRHLLARQDFGSHLLVYVVINAIIVVVWASTGAGYFWPGWVLAGWGAGLILHARETFWRRPITDADIDAEIRRRKEAR